MTSAAPDQSAAAAGSAGGAGARGEVSIGVICMDTSFTKIPGHIRNRTTFDFPVAYEVVAGATAERLVTRPDPSLLGPFQDAARALEARGVAAITAACGFLALFQRQLADAVKIPLYASSLLQLPMVHRMIRSDQRVGLLVANKRTFSRRHLAAIGGESVPVCIAGMADQPEFREVLLEGRRDELDADRLRLEVMSEVDQLLQDNSDTGAFLLECTDLAPFAYAVGERTGLPVFDIVTLTELVHHSLTRQPYGRPQSGNLVSPGQGRGWPAPAGTGP